MVTRSIRQEPLSVRRLAPAVILVLSGGLSIAALAAPDDKAIASACYGCHGAAADNTSLPTLQNFTSAELLRTLREYRSGARQGTLMPRIAKGYAPEELERLAQHFGRDHAQRTAD